MARADVGPWDWGAPALNRSRRSCCASLYELPIAQLLLADSFHPGGSETTRQLVNMMAVGRGDLVVDVACGAGGSARFLNREYGVDIVGVDVSIPNLRKALPGGKRQLNRVAGAASSLPLAAESVDGALCECALCTFDDPDKALREMYRTLKPGASVGISDMTVDAAVPQELQGVLGHALCLSGALSRNQLEGALGRAGFATVRVQDATAALLGMTRSIEKKLELLQRSAHTPVEMPDDWGDAGAVLRSAHAFIQSGGLQYGLFVARKR